MNTVPNNCPCFNNQKYTTNELNVVPFVLEIHSGEMLSLLSYDFGWGTIDLLSRIIITEHDLDEVICMHQNRHTNLDSCWVLQSLKFAITLLFHETGMSWVMYAKFDPKNVSLSCVIAGAQTSNDFVCLSKDRLSIELGLLVLLMNACNRIGVEFHQWTRTFVFYSQHVSNWVLGHTIYSPVRHAKG